MKMQGVELVVVVYVSEILLLYHPIPLLPAMTMTIDLEVLLSIHALLIFTPSHLTSNLHPTNKNLTDKLQPGHKHTKPTRNNKMANASADIQPTALIPDQPEEIHRQHIANRHDEHEKTARRNTESSVEDAQVGADDGERDDDFEHEEEALGERVEDREEAVDGVEGEGGEGGDVAGGEESGLEEVEEEEGDAGVGEGEGAVWGCGCVGGFTGGGLQLC